VTKGRSRLTVIAEIATILGLVVAVIGLVVAIMDYQRKDDIAALGPSTINSSTSAAGPPPSTTAAQPTSTAPTNTGAQRPSATSTSVTALPTTPPATGSVSQDKAESSWRNGISWHSVASAFRAVREWGSDRSWWQLALWALVAYGVGFTLFKIVDRALWSDVWFGVPLFAMVAYLGVFWFSLSWWGVVVFLFGGLLTFLIGIW
jgi:hypothetical protein